MKKLLVIFLALSLVILSCEDKTTEPPRQNTGDVSGVVTNALTSEPIDQAQVAIIGSAARSVSTNASGYYIFEDLPIDEDDLTQVYNLQVTKAGFRDKTEAVEVHDNQNTTKNFTLDPIPPIMQVSVTSIDFGASSSTSFTISNSSQYGSFHWHATDDATWLTVAPTDGGPIEQNSQAITCTADRANLSPGNYNASLTITTQDQPAGVATISVSMAVSNPLQPQLSVSPLSLDFGDQDSELQLRLRNTGTGMLFWDAFENLPWLELSPNSGSLNSGQFADVVLTTDRQGLDPGQHRGEVFINTNPESAGKDTFVVTMTVRQPDPNLPVLSVNPISLDFGEHDTLLYSQLRNNGEGMLTWIASEDIDWLRVRPNGGDLETGESSNIALIAARQGLTAGHHNGTVYINSNGGNDSILVSVTVPDTEDPPLLSIDPRTLDFGEQDSVLHTQISNTGGGTLSWTGSENINWLTITPADGDIGAGGSQDMTLTTNREGLDPGQTFNGIVYINSNGGNDSVQVQLSVPYPIPNAPSDLTAVAVSMSQINLAWQDNSDNEDGFIIERHTEGENWADIHTTGIDVETYQDTNLESNTSYFYQVRAFNNGGESQNSNEASATTESGELEILAFVADRYSGLIVIDVSDPQNPDSIGGFDTGYALGVFAVGQYAYVADFESGLIIFDVSDPANPDSIGGCNTPGNALSVKVIHGYSYIADYRSGLQVIDVSDPHNPEIVGDLDTDGYANYVFISGDYAYLACSVPSYLFIVNISDPNNPEMTGSLQLPGNAQGVFVLGDYAYVADYDAGLQIVDVSNPANPEIIGNYDTPDYSQGVFAIGNYAYVADNASALQIIDISDPRNPERAGVVDTPHYAHAVYVIGGYAYVADVGSGLQIIDVSNPRDPQGIVGSYDTPDEAIDVFITIGRR